MNFGYEEPNYRELIADAERLYNKQKQEAEDAAKLLELVDEELFRVIRQYTTRYDYMEAIIKAAFDELKQIDKTETQFNLESLERFISEDFFDSKVAIHITEMMWYGFEHCAINIYFNFNDITYVLEIPLKAHLPFNKEHWAMGKYQLQYKKEEHYYSILFSSYIMEDVRDYILKNILKESKDDA